MPESTVWCVSSSRRTTSAGSSSCRRCRPVISRSSSPVVFGSIAIESIGSTELEGATHDRRALRREGVADPHVGELRDGDDVACRRPRLTWRGRLAADRLQHVQALLGAGAGVDQHRVGTERSREDLEQRDAADEGVDDGLEDPRERLAVGVEVRSRSPGRRRVRASERWPRPRR